MISVMTKKYHKHIFSSAYDVDEDTTCYKYLNRKIISWNGKVEI
jgi:hypothetical protein